MTIAELRRWVPEATLNLSSWFAAVALVAITGISSSVGLMLDWFIEEQLLRQQAALTQEFVQSLVLVEKPLVAYFNDPSGGVRDDVEQSLAHIAVMPDMLRANVYSRDRQVIWSSNPEMIGRRFGPNRELDAALAGQLMTHHDDEEYEEHGKPEHEALKARKSPSFVEIYVPVIASRGGAVLGVIEFYKHPRGLLDAKAKLRTYLLLGAVIAGTLLFIALFGMVRRADLTIRQQQRQLIDRETLAAIGEMSSAVAHGLRNPLASIRSSAEMIGVAEIEVARSAAADIVDRSDRLAQWVDELLTYTRPENAVPAPVALGPLIEKCLDDIGFELLRRDIALQRPPTLDLPAVRGNALLLGQALRSILTNAIEAAGRQGAISMDVGLVAATIGQGDQVHIAIHDTGPGMSAEELALVGQPFHTTKPRGMGVGLALARRVTERFGGHLEIQSAAGKGTTVTLNLLTS
ncbi:MAG: hypothetical protein RL722_659 [Pseudomonadota bacterium]